MSAARLRGKGVVERPGAANGSVGECAACGTAQRGICGANERPAASNASAAYEAHSAVERPGAANDSVGECAACGAAQRGICGANERSAASNASAAYEAHSAVERPGAANGSVGECAACGAAQRGICAANECPSTTSASSVSAACEACKAASASCRAANTSAAAQAKSNHGKARPTASSVPPRSRELWLDALRVGAAFLVIVNHTNSYVFKAAAPQQAAWWLSILWYYVSKVAVPLFVMVSGACLLPREDSYRRVLARAGRVLAALVLFSYGYYLYDAWVYWGLWPRMADVGAFWRLMWPKGITDSFWYLYFYLGLMAMLPMLQRLHRAMNARDMAYLVGACFLLDGLWPLLAHYAPGLAPSEYLSAPLFTGYVGLFFAGDWVRRCFRPTRRGMMGAGLLLAASLTLSVALTRLEYARVGAGERYWFMDDRMHPSCLTMLASASVMMLCKGWLANAERGSHVLTELGKCAFGVYLVQDWLIEQTKGRLFEPLCAAMPAMAAVLLWEMAVFAVALGIAWALRRVPGVRRVL